MPTTTLEGHTLHVDAEGFMTDPSEWTEDVASVLAGLIGLALTPDHLRVIRFLRSDYAEAGETATLRRVSSRLAIPIKTLFQLFPGKPAKKMAYVAGLPKPRGCV